MTMLRADEHTDLRYAKELLETPGLAAKVTNTIGFPIERGIAMLPDGASRLISGATRKAIGGALQIVMRSLDDRPRIPASDGLHKMLAAASGAAGGAWGLVSLPIELPASTAIMLRSIMDIARSEGEPIRTVDARLACLEVLALGGARPTDDATETGYYAARAALAHAVHEASKHLARYGLSETSAPPIVRLITVIATRFGVVVSEKAAAQLVPVVGAAGGAIVNTIFLDHFQAMARGHFIVRRLERVHGGEAIAVAYDAI